MIESSQLLPGMKGCKVKQGRWMVCARPAWEWCSVVLSAYGTPNRLCIYSIHTVLLNPHCKIEDTKSIFVIHNKYLFYS